MFLRKVVTTRGAVRLVGADITGTLSCDGAHLEGRDSAGNALAAERLKVGRDVFLRKVVTARGAVRLVGADITGTLRCDGAHLEGRDSAGNALAAERLKTGGTVHLDGGFTAAGAVRLYGADITGDLSCRGAQLTGSSGGDALCAVKLDALVAVELKVGGDVFLDSDALLHKEFTVAGAVQLSGADITGTLSCDGAHLEGRDSAGNALAAERLKVGRDVFLRKVVTTRGAVRLVGADITGTLRCDGAHLEGRDSASNALAAERLKTGGAVHLDGGFTAAARASRWRRGSGRGWTLTQPIFMARDCTYRYPRRPDEAADTPCVHPAPAEHHAGGRCPRTIVYDTRPDCGCARRRPRPVLCSKGR